MYCFYTEKEFVMDTDGSRIILGCCLCGAFIAAGGYFQLLRTALVEMNDNKLKSDAARSESSALLYELTRKPVKLMCAFTAVKRITRLFAFLSLSYAFFLPAERLMSGLIKSDVLRGALAAAALYVITKIIYSALSEYIPKRCALGGGYESFVLKRAKRIKNLCVFFTPLTAVVTRLGGFAGEVLGVHIDENGDTVTEEEILMMVDAGNETGVIEESQKEMINNIFDFDDLTVSDVMTHRTNISAVEHKTSISDIVYLAINGGRSRIPVYDGDIDSIVGIIYVKDLLCLVGHEDTSGFNIDEFIRDVIYTPQSNSCAEVFRQMTATKTQMAVVIDEYGGTAGIVTMEDLLESIVGSIQDEYDDEIEEFSKVSDGVYVISGSAGMDEAFSLLNIPLPDEGDDEGDFETISGFLISLLGNIPKEGECPQAEYGGVRFTVLLSDDKKIVKIKAEKITQE